MMPIIRRLRRSPPWSATFGSLLKLDEPVAAAGMLIDYWSGNGAWRAMEDWQQEKVVARIGAVLSDFDAVFGNQLNIEDYAALEIPTLLMSGSLTRPSVGRVVEILSDSLPSVRAVELPDTGHMGPITHADQVNRLISEFIHLYDTSQTSDSDRSRTERVA